MIIQLTGALAKRGMEVVGLGRLAARIFISVQPVDADKILNTAGELDRIVTSTGELDRVLSSAGELDRVVTSTGIG